MMDVNEKMSERSGWEEEISEEYSSSSESILLEDKATQTNRKKVNSISTQTLNEEVLRQEEFSVRLEKELAKNQLHFLKRIAYL